MISVNSQVPEGYRQTDVGVIPDDWECKKLEEYFSLISYGFTNPMPTVKDGIFMITAADISEGRIQLETARKTTREAYNILLSAKSKPQKNDVLLTKDGSLGRLALVGEEQICINQSVAVIRPNKKVEPNFLKLLLESQYYQEKMLEDAGGSTIKHIYITIVNSMMVGLPSRRDEQRAIASTLSDIDNLLASLDQLIAKKRDLKQATMQQLLTGKKRLPGFSETKEYKKTEAGEIPADWNIFTIGETATLINGRAFKPSDWSTSGAPIIRIQNLNDPMATYNYYEGDVESRYYVELGDLLFAWSGTKESSFGARVWHGEKAILNQHIFRVVPDTKKLSSQYLFLALKRFQEEIEKKSHGFKSSFVHIKKLDLENTYLAVPSIPEQTAIAEILSDIDTELTTLQTRRTKTQALKQAMMQQLLTGQTRLI